MRPTTPIEVLARALHFLRDDGHDCRDDCPVLAMDTSEAEDVVQALGAIGWHLSRDLSLSESAPRGREGTLDLTDFTEQVLSLFVRGPLSTYELNARYADLSDALPGLYPKRAFDTPRKRLVELERAGFVRKLTRDGKQSTRHHIGVAYGVWELTDKGRQAIRPASEVAA